MLLIYNRYLCGERTVMKKEDSAVNYIESQIKRTEETIYESFKTQIDKTLLSLMNQDIEEIEMYDRVTKEVERLEMNLTLSLKEKISIDTWNKVMIKVESYLDNLFYQEQKDSLVENLRK